MKPEIDVSPADGKVQQAMFNIIFLHDRPARKAFDVVLLVMICFSVLAVLLESVPSLHERHGHTLLAIEWTFTILFTIEYVLRLACVKRPLRYAVSFYGIVDLLAILPTFVSLLFPGAQSLIVIRALRLLRVFRVLKLAHYTGEANSLAMAMRASRRKITVFIFSVAMIVLIVGAAMYLIEGPDSGFTSIPLSCYWAIVTLTTVGYGDIAPVTPLGRLLASALMLTGYGIIAVPTGIVTAELVAQDRRGPRGAVCPSCGLRNHDADAQFCKRCGQSLPT
ncbi:MAG TPA: ion transporter [Tepidisphaeraceae bacterium]|jgi:voltage-gated potassium channel|nr:ion transporter [Tepidisphaeraceae bacterium]